MWPFLHSLLWAWHRFRSQPCDDGIIAQLHGQTSALGAKKKQLTLKLGCWEGCGGLSNALQCRKQNDEFRRNDVFECQKGSDVSAATCIASTRAIASFWGPTLPIPERGD